MPSPLASLRSRLARAGDYGRKRSPLLRRVPPLHDLLELAARVGYGARGFVYLSAGLLILLAAADLVGDAVGVKGAIAWVALRPFGRLWLLLLGLGLTAFVTWRLLQAVFDADHEGTSRHGLMTRMGQGFSAMTYGILAFSAFGLLMDKPTDTKSADITKSREQAEAVLSLPFGNWLLAGAGLCILGIGLANISRAWREDFTEYLACSPRMGRRVAPLARAGYVARGLAYVPLAILVMLAGLRAKASDVTTFGLALDAVERQPAGPWILAVTALGFVAFGAFSFIEARFRRIRLPRVLDPLT
ncbi:MAG: DUF1206 domain-containing protein [Brevundimonas sp.]|uniref:DUF1206 domain-containing protein n=1 Tax=Brevundimonas sp. TaxID=1871086 RepID=UPI00248A147A|nr:DUF1206 domain-containing protein [Brevundimonas sp.]MDI1327950.1 DUF1206 domain-containing protein [Brevundimonas sp.]